MSCKAGKQLGLVLTGLVLLLALAGSPALPHDFGGPSGGGPPPGGDGCPGCCEGGGCAGCGGGGDPVNFWDGAERYYHTDFVIFGFFPLQFARAYDSQSEYDGPLGYGWSHSFNYRLFRFPDGRAVIRKNCGARREFLYSGGAFITPVGEIGTLVDNFDGTFDYVEGTGYTLKFDERGRLIRIDNVHGTSVRITYDPAGKLPLTGLSPYSPSPTQARVVAYDYRPTRVEEYDSLDASTGRFYTFAYDGGTGRLTSVSDHDSRTWSYEHDDAGNLTSVTDPLLNMINYTYEDSGDAHNLTGITGGLVDATMTYDTEDRVTVQTYGDIEAQITYTTPGLQTDVTYVTYEAAVVVASSSEIWEFDGNGSVTIRTDDAGNETHWTRNPAGQPTLREYYENTGTLDLVETISYTYNTAGLVENEVTTTLPGGETVTRDYTYDQGALTSVSEYASSDPTQIYFRDYTYEYGGGGEPLHVIQYRRQTNPGGGVAEYDVTTAAYDDNGTITSMMYPGGDTTNIVSTNGYATDVDGVLYGRDARGNITSVTFGAEVTTYGYDDLDRVTSVEVAGVGTSTYVYSGLQLIQAVHPTYTVDYEYDAVGRLIRVVQTVGGSPTTLAEIVYDKTAGTATVTGADAAVYVLDWDPLHVWQQIENPETQSPVPSVFPVTNYIGPTFADPLADFLMRVLNQPGVTLPVQTM